MTENEPKNLEVVLETARLAIDKTLSQTNIQIPDLNSAVAAIKQAMELGIVDDIQREKVLSDLDSRHSALSSGLSTATTEEQRMKIVNLIIIGLNNYRQLLDRIKK